MHLLMSSPDRQTDRPTDRQIEGPSILVLAAPFQGTIVTLHGKGLRPSRAVLSLILVPWLVGLWALAEGQLMGWAGLGES